MICSNPPQAETAEINYKAAKLQKAKRIAGTEKAALRWEYEGKPELVAYSENAIAICDCLSACKWTGSFMAGGCLFDETYQATVFSAGTGIPTRETLEAAGLGDVAKDLEKRGKLPGPSPKGKGSKE